jgi:cyclophilin family peptidyl-prolyl cis-trans isomerase
MRRFAVLVLTLTVATAACGGDGADAVDSPAYLAFRDQPTACGASRPEPATAVQFDEAGEAGVQRPVRAVLQTSCGAVTLELDPTLAPATVNSFVFLAEEGFFDGTVSHRVVPGFVIQAGDPTATGLGDPGYSLPDEFPEPDFAYTRGVVAMANSGLPNSGGSQFFLVLADISLPPTFTVFGRVVDGFEVMDTIAAVELGPQPPDAVPSRPLESVYLERVEITR